MTVKELLVYVGLAGISTLVSARVFAPQPAAQQPAPPCEPDEAEAQQPAPSAPKAPSEDAERAARALAALIRAGGAPPSMLPEVPRSPFLEETIKDPRRGLATRQAIAGAV